ncbi:MAG: YihY/virulence factor BrkB family protein [Acidobacteria bacterium]|nr:YihY/virulence factor BrkB family protein [Acidobacteriota bacterium]
MRRQSAWRTVAGLSKQLRQSGLSINAAAVAYNAFLALVPLAFAMLGIAAAIGKSTTAVERIGTTLDPIVPATVKTFVTDLLVDAGDRVGGGSVWLVFGSVTVALFFGSRAVVALQKSLAAVEDRTEQRPALQMRLVAMGLTLAGGVALGATSVFLVTGRRLVEFAAGFVGNELVLDLWTWLRVPMAAAGLYLFLTALYRFGPPEPLPRARLAALVGTTGAVLGSLGFGLYLGAAPELGATFGVLGAVAIALVWLYVGAMAILLGAVTVSYLTQSGAESSREVRPGEGGGS